MAGDGKENNGKNVKSEPSQTESPPDQSEGQEEPNPDGSQQRSTREKFLLEMYTQLWQSIQRVESGMWSFVAAFGAIAVSLIAAFQQQIPLVFASMFGLILSFWGMNLAVTSSRWMNRNLLQVGNLEREFLADDDYGYVLPEEYVSGSHNFLDINDVNFHDINFAGFLSALVIVVVSTFAAGAHRLLALEIGAVQLLVLLGVSTTILNVRTSLDTIDQFQDGTGSDPDSNTIVKKIRSDRIYFSTTIFTALFSLVIYGINRFVNQSELLTVHLLSLVCVSVVYIAIVPDILISITENIILDKNC